MEGIQSKKIAKGDVNAYKNLYSRNKDRVFHICNLLLCDELSANDSVKAVFKSAFFEISKNPKLADGFSQMVEKKAVDYCKIKIAKGNNKEFLITASKNFTSIGCSESNVATEGKTEFVILKNLPSLYRFIYVQGELLKWSNAEIGEFFHTSKEVIKLAREAEDANIAKIARCVSLATAKELTITKSELTSLLECAEGSFEFDIETEKAMFRIIDDAVAPVKESNKKKNRKSLLIALIASAVVLLIAGIVCAVLLNPSDDLSNRTKREYTAPYSNAEDITHYATIDIEDYGKVKLALLGNVAPITVENFVSLANKGFYNGLTFHRIMEGFMAQGGCPDGNGTGGHKDADGNEINIKGEFSVNGVENPISHKRGVISMARNGYSYDSASSQFFIVHEDSESLDGQYAAFGYVVEGMEFIDFICEDAKPTDDNGTISASAQPKIKSITVETVK